MKTPLVLCLAATLLGCSASAQVFRPETVNGAVIGGLAGAVIGNNSGDLHHNGARGAALGAVAGAVIGTAVGQGREQGEYRGTQVGYRGEGRSRSSVSIGLGWGGDRWGSPYRRRGAYSYSGYRYGYAPSVVYDYGYAEPLYPGYTYSDDFSAERPSGAVTGALLGGIAGGIIGNNSGHRNGWQGAAIGAGAGLLLGGWADQNARAREVARVPVYSAETQPAVAPAAPQNVTIINNYYGSSQAPMASANGLFGR